MLDKLSALISAMNDKYGADLGEADKVWVDQQWVVVKEDDEMREVALNNDRSQFEMVLEQKVKDLLIDRHDKNGVLFDLFFSNPDFQVSLVRYRPAPTTSSVMNTLFDLDFSTPLKEATQGPPPASRGASSHFSPAHLTAPTWEDITRWSRSQNREPRIGTLWADRLRDVARSPGGSGQRRGCVSVAMGASGARSGRPGDW